MQLSEYKPIALPLRLQVGRKLYSLSNNRQRNWHFQEQANIKKNFEVRASLEFILAKWIPVESFPIGIRYEYWLPPNADYENYHALICKYFQDAMVKKGIIPDDSTKYIVESTVRYLGTRRKKDGEPEVIISLYEVNHEQGTRAVEGNWRFT